MTHHYLWVSLFFSTLFIDASAQAPSQVPNFDYFNFAFHKYFFDISTDGQNVWERKEHDCASDIPKPIMEVFAGVPKYSQSHLSAMLQSNIRLGVFTLTVPEKQYFMASGMEADNFSKITRCVAGFQRRTEALLSTDVSYFDELIQHIRFLKAVEETPYYKMGRKFRFQIIRNTADLDAVIKDPTIIGGLFNIFGAHNLSSYFYIDKNLVGTDDFKQTVRKNVERLKGQRPLVENSNEYLDVPILFMSIAGSFRNGFGGDTKRSMVGSENEQVFKETIEAKEALSTVGQDLVRQLLDKREGRRILVNVKGLSAKARSWIYDYYSQLRYQGDTIPIFAVDISVHGESWNNEKIGNTRENASRILPLHDEAMAREDLQNILESKGLLTISLDQAQLTKESKTVNILAKQVAGSAEHRAAALQVVLAHVLRCVQVIQDKAIWDHIGISTAFDGANRPFPMYENAEQIQSLKKDLTELLKNPQPIFDLYTAQQVRQFMYDYTAEEIIEKLFSSNATRVTRECLKGLEKQAEQQQAEKKD